MGPDISIEIKLLTYAAVMFSFAIVLVRKFDSFMENRIRPWILEWAWKRGGEMPLGASKEGELVFMELRFKTGVAMTESRSFSTFHYKLDLDDEEVSIEVFEKGKPPVGRTAYLCGLLTDERLDAYLDSTIESVAEGWDPTGDPALSEVISDLEVISSTGLKGVIGVVLTSLAVKTALEQRKKEIEDIAQEMELTEGSIEIESKLNPIDGVYGMTIGEEIRLLTGVDIRLHKAEWVNGYSGRSLGVRVAHEWASNKHSHSLDYNINESGPWKNVVFEQNVPYHLAWPLSMRPTGVKESFLKILHALEKKGLDPKLTLLAFLHLLLMEGEQRAKVFRELTESIENLSMEPANQPSELVLQHSVGHWRTLELATHALMQVVYENGMFLPVIEEVRRPLKVKPGNVADEKSGDIGDVQFAHDEYVDEVGKKYIEYAIDCKKGEGTQNVSSDLIGVARRWSHPKVPQDRLRVFEWVHNETPFADEQPETTQAIEFLESKGVTLRYNSLRDLQGEFNLNHEQAYEWLERYGQLLTKDETMEQDYGIPTETTSVWAVKLTEAIVQLGSQSEPEQASDPENGSSDESDSSE